MINCCLVRPASLRGMGTFCFNILKQIEALKSGHTLILVTNSRESEKFLKSHFQEGKDVVVVCVTAPFPIFEQFVVPIIVWKMKPDVFVHSGDTASLLIRNFKVNNALLLHDVYFTYRTDYRLTLKGYLSRFYRAVTVRLCVYRATNVVTVSEFARKEILKAYPRLDPRVLSIAPNGPSFEPLPFAAIEKQEVLLIVSGPDPQKNLSFFLRGVQENQGFLDELHRVVVVGVDAAVSIGADEHPKIKYCGYMAATELSELFSSARFLAVPSLKESFGIPALDGLLNGCRLLVSRSGALPEVVGDFGIFFDPHCVDSLDSALSQSRSEPKLSVAQMEKQAKYACRFNWSSSAKALLTAIEGQREI